MITSWILLISLYGKGVTYVPGYLTEEACKDAAAVIKTRQGAGFADVTYSTLCFPGPELFSTFHNLNVGNPK